MLPERVALFLRPPPRIGARTQLATFQVLEKFVFEKLGRTLFEEEEKKRLQGLIGISEPWPCNPVDAIQFRDFLSSLLFFFTK